MLLASCYFLLATTCYYLPLMANCYFLLDTYYLLLVSCFLLPATWYLILIYIWYLLLFTTCYLLVATCAWYWLPSTCYILLLATFYLILFTRYCVCACDLEQFTRCSVHKHYWHATPYFLTLDLSHSACHSWLIPLVLPLWLVTLDLPLLTWLIRDMWHMTVESPRGAFAPN